MCTGIAIEASVPGVFTCELLKMFMHSIRLYWFISRHRPEYQPWRVLTSQPPAPWKQTCGPQVFFSLLVAQSGWTQESQDAESWDEGS